jgi:hypothetical protein
VKREEHSIYIRPDGTIQFIYHDALSALTRQAQHLQIQRVSSVEADAQGQWVADLSPVGGPVSPPFALREDALRWEVAWLEQQLSANTLTIGGK